ncbi:sec-independent protein translocase protein TATB, chloroplastic-like isoform X1 [Oryza glaberrima]|uniref:sec-independent protein translocase protein TATB, chloroplastic-like isoform X1 n=1 Tax=Oryza glaberrima TaxID=4538 RepID=UPI00224BF712|nr:sec-independent protein translocase protein TATB, chloroplastic-like isoform X1 [Oryza glaberrima]
MAIAGLLLRPPPCVATCTPTSPSLSSQWRRRRLTLAQPYCAVGLSFVSGRHLRRRRRSDDKPEAAPYTSEELMKVIEEQLAASAAAAWNTQEPPPSQQKEAAATSESNDGAISRGSDGAGAAMSEPNRNISEKMETER